MSKIMLVEKLFIISFNFSNGSNNEEDGEDKNVE